MFQTIVIVSLVGLAATTAVRAEDAPTAANPYGVCAHLAWGDEHPTAREELALMREAGIGWVRADFAWQNIQPKRDVWRFDHLDETVAWAKAAGVRILPILDYSVPWANPAHRHLDDWRQYVETLVTRYRDEITAWEVWNEPNLDQFWPEPNPADYAALLEATCTTIKAADPDALVVFGGTAHVDLSFIEGVYRSGGGRHFDVMAVHPYCHPVPPEQGDITGDLHRLRRLMARYGDENKPIWVTEIGWPTNDTPDWWSDIISTGLDALAPKRKRWRIAVLSDAAVPLPTTSDDVLPGLAADGATFHRVGIDGLQTLAPSITHALLMPPAEAFPAGRAFDAVVDYVRRGGIVIFWQGVPLYYAVSPDPDGGWSKATVAAPESYRRQLHIGWEAFWTRDGVPRWADLSLPEQWGRRIDLKQAPRGSRFLTESALEPGDRMIPLVMGRAGEYAAPVAAAYDFNSSLKGGAVVVTLRGPVLSASPRQQATYLPRAMLLMLSTHVDRAFWYEFQAMERSPTDKEHHFGVVHRDLSPKPAYAAYQALTQLRPPGSQALGEPETTGSGYVVGWRRPDGTKVWAAWNLSPDVKQRAVATRGDLAEVRNHLGGVVQATDGGVSLSGSPFYLIGPDEVVIEPRSRTHPEATDNE